MDAHSNTYSCHAFHSDLPGGRSSGTVSVSQQRLIFSIAEQNIELPVAGLELTMGGASNRLIFISHPRYPQWRFYTSERRFLKDPHLLSSPAGVKLKAARNHHLRAWSVFGAVAVMVIAIPLLLIFRMDLVSGLVAKQIPLEWEQSLGESTVAQYKIGKQFMAEEQARVLLQPLVNPLLTARDSLRYQYQFNIVHDASINAFALPGGQIVIHSALILEAETAAELLGVLAHEMMHVEQQHGVRNVLGMAGIYAVVGAVLGDVSGILATLSTAAPILLNQSYSRGFEKQADVLGFALLRKANIDPSGLVSFFVRLKKQEEEQLAKIENEDAREMLRKVMAYVSTHPATDTRINNLEKLLESGDTADQTVNLSNEFEQLQMAVKAFTNKTQGEIENDEK